MIRRQTFEVYPAKDGWRWRLIAGNGRIRAASQEAFASKYNAMRAARDVWAVLGAVNRRRTRMRVLDREP